VNQLSFIEDWKSESFDKIIALYDSVGWSVYTKNQNELYTAFLNSSFMIMAKAGDEIIGILRSISDDVSIHYLQDILILPTAQNQGIGRKMIDLALNRYAHGEAFISYLNNKFESKGGMLPFLSWFFLKYKFVPVTTEILKSELEIFFATDLTEDFQTYIYN